MSVVVRVIRCADCPKVHCAAGVGRGSRCACGAGLYWRLWEIPVADDRSGGSR